MRRVCTRGTLSAAIVAGALALAAPAAWGATITVNSTGDSAADDGACTLREAITAANGNAESGALAGECAAGEAAPVEDTVEFTISGTGQHVFSPATLLPAITEVVILDGGTDGDDEIRLDGAGSLSVGLDVEADGVKLKELTLTRFGTAIDIADTDSVEVENSHIGTDQAGSAALGNTTGIRVGADSVPASGAVITSNVISSNSSFGVTVGGPGSLDNVIESNRIGTNPAGTAALPNGTGVQVRTGADDTLIGGDVPLAGNLISGNDTTGVEVNSSATDAATGTVVQGNRIGTNLVGEAAIANAQGITLSGAADQTTIRDNLISGNGGRGVQLVEAGAPAAAPSQTTIAGNLIGTDKDGVQALGNADGGVILQGVAEPMTDNVIGGSAGLTPGGACTGDCNVIAANGTGLVDAGVLVAGPDAGGTRILGNHIGADVTGLAALGNSGRSTLIGAGGAGIVVGEPGAGNVIGASGAEAILLEEDASAVSVQANLIGVGSDGATSLGNGTHNVLIRGGSSDNTVGGTGAGEGNLIANSDDAGVRVEDASVRNAILGNSLVGNGGLGIELFGAFGPDANDPLDADAGPNDLQNHPVLAGAVAESGATVIGGSLASEPLADYRIEVFTSAVADISGFGEGEELLGSFTVSTDAVGEVRFAETIAAEAAPGAFITATATRLGSQSDPGSTSEFGPNITEGCDNVATAGADVVAGTAADEVLCGLGGDDVIAPGGGDDLVVGGAGDDELDLSAAGAGADLDLANGLGTVGSDDLGAVGVENATGTSFADTLVGTGAANVLDGGDGGDDLEGAGGGDTLLGGAGGDDLDGGEGGDVINGGDGSDTANGNAGKDTLKGQDGKDTLKGGDGKSDELKGGKGSDSLNGGADKKDFCDGGKGKDRRKAPGCETKRSLP